MSCEVHRQTAYQAENGATGTYTGPRVEVEAGHIAADRRCDIQAHKLAWTQQPLGRRPEIVQRVAVDKQVHNSAVQQRRREKPP